MARPCPSGHPSTELDYCSHCGAPMAPEAAVLPSPQPPRASAPARTSCALCRKALRAEDDPCCLLCGYDLTLPPLPPLQRSSSPRPVLPGWTLVLRVDPSLDDDPDPACPCPAAQADTEHELQTAEFSVGRHDAQPRPSLPLRDPGASRRHAVFLQEEGALWLRDLGSTNGTRLNGATIEAQRKIPLKSGDEVTLGRWTRILVRACSPST